MVAGVSKIELCIFEGDVLVVHRALSPQHDDVVVAEIDGAFTIEQLYRRNGLMQLRAGNPTYQPIIFWDRQTMTICGVVTVTIKRFR